MQKARNRRKHVERAFVRGTRKVEEIHRSISDLPFHVLDRLGILGKSGNELKAVHDDSVAAVYDTIRDVAHKVTEFVEELDEDLTRGRQARKRAVRAA